MTAQLVNPKIPRVDAVDEPATGIPWLILKSANPTPPKETAAVADPVTPAAEAAPVAKADDAGIADLEAAAAVPGSPEWEGIDAAQAAKVVEGLVGLKAIVGVLSQREAAEGDYENEWDLSDACDALDWALGVLAKYAVNEEAEASTVAKAEKLVKALLPAPQAPEAPATPEAVEKAASEAQAAAPVAKADEGAEEVLPPGLKELLDTFIAGYAQLNAGAAPAMDPAAASPALVEEPGAAPVEDSADAAPAAPAAPAEAKPADPAPAAPAEHKPEAPAAAPAAPAEAAPAEKPAEAPVKDAAEAPADPAAPATPAAPAEGEDDENKLEDLKKALEADWEARLAKAVEAHTAPLLKRIGVLEAMPVDDGPMLNGHTPAARGEAGVTVAKSVAVPSPFQPAPVAKSAVTGRDLGNPLAAALTGVWSGQ